MQPTKKFLNLCLIPLSLVLFPVAAAKMTSVHSAYVTEVHDVPMSVIIRPFIPELDEKKVESLMETIQVCDIEVNSLK